MKPDNLTARNRITKYLMYAIIPLGELQQRWKDVSYNVNPWFNRDYPLDVEWFVKFLCVHLSFIIIGAVLIRAFRMQDISLRVAAWTLMIVFIFDFYRFFDDFKKAGGYLLFYAAIPFISAFVEHLVKTDFFWRLKEWAMAPYWEYKERVSRQIVLSSLMNSGQGVQECDARKDELIGGVRYINKNHGAEVQISD